MSENLFKNDNIVGNSLISFEIMGIFDCDDEVLLENLKNVLNREVSFSNIEYKLLKPTDTKAVLLKDGIYSIIRTPLYSYFEAIYILPNVLELLKGLKEFKNTHLYFTIGFNKDFCKIECMNITKFILDFDEDKILKSLGDFTINGEFEKLTNMKPKSLDKCNDGIQKQIESLRYIGEEDNVYGIDFSELNIGMITFKYAAGINYRSKWEDILKALNHTIVTVYNSSKYPELTDEHNKKIGDIDKEFEEDEKSFRCFELFKEKYKGIKITSDLNDDKAVIDVIFPTIKDKLFDIVICNGIRTAEINYDTDVSRFQIKDITLKSCYHLSGVDIVESEIQNSNIRNCDIYDTKITNSTILKCNLFGYSDCKDSKFKDCFISRNIELKDCIVTGKLGKMGGIMHGGTIKDTTMLIDTAELDDKVEKINVNEII